MARTRTSIPFPDDDDQRRQDLIAAAFVLEEKSATSLLYNSQVIDTLTNSIEAGDTSVAWYYWSRLPELRYVSRYISNALSVATLYVGVADNSGSPPKRLPENHPANDLMEDFAGGYTGQSELLDRLGLHLTVAGDSVIMGPRSGTGTLEPPFNQWRVYSNQEVHSRGGRVFLKFPGNSKEVQAPPGAMAVRIWRPHPRLWWDADSPVKGSFQVLKELDMLNQHILASASSRLVGAGLLGIPEELDLPTADTETEGTEVDQFVALLIEIMGMAKKNPESPAARIPIMLRGPAEYIDKIKHFDFSTEFSDMVPELRTGAIRRLALGMDVPPEILLGSEQSTSWCVDPETEILTTTGWMKYEDLIPGETVVRTLNHVSGLSEWNLLQGVAVFNLENEPMLSMEGYTHSSLTTMNHRWPVGRKTVQGTERVWATSETLGSTDLILTGAPAADLPEDPKYSDAFVELMAWFYTEGHIRGDSVNRVRTTKDVGITQSHSTNPANVASIRRALDTFCPGQYSERARSSGRTDFQLFIEPSKAFLEQCDEKKVIEKGFILSLTQSQLELFIRTSLLADRVSGSNDVFGQAVEGRSELFEFACIIAGYSTYKRKLAPREKFFNGYNFKAQEQTHITVHRRKSFAPKDKHKTVVDYTGMVWCPVTVNGTWLARRNGRVFYTGNSAWQTDDSTLRVHLIPLLQLITSSLTVGWLRPMMESLPLSKEQKEEIPNLVVHFDVSNLKIHQDVSGDAQALYDRFGIDADSLRMNTGYSADSAPDNEELARQILLTLIATGQPELVNYAVDGLRKNFGIDLLPKPPEAPAPPGPGAPPGGAAPKATAPVEGPLPGPRSQAKQVSPPPVPKPGGDQGNNEVK